VINTSFKILEIILIISYTCFNISFSSDPKDPQLQLYRHTGIQLYRYPGIRLSSYTGIQLYRYTGIQVSGHTGMHAPMQYPACMVDLGTLLRSKCPRVRQRLDFLKKGRVTLHHLSPRSFTLREVCHEQSIGEGNTARY